jgi:hypothetical protein
LTTLAALATVAIVAGCGSSPSTPARVLSEPGYSVEVPEGWKVVRHARLLSVSLGDSKLEVRQFPLRRAYDPALFAKVAPEIDRVARQLAARLGAETTGRTVTVSGLKAWQYDFAHDAVFERLTFVLRGKVEYQLYCRRANDAANGPCDRLVASFTLR